MTPVEEMTDEQFEKHTLDILARELGPLGLARYVRLHGLTSGDYTRDRHQWLDRLTYDDVVEQVKKVKIPKSK